MSFVMSHVMSFVMSHVQKPANCILCLSLIDLGHASVRTEGVDMSATSHMVANS